jgi:hypothetical protein
MTSEFEDAPSWQAARGGLASETAHLAARRYREAASELERAYLLDEIRLNPATTRIIIDQLRIIDRAIAEAQRALENDPNSDYLADHYAQMERRRMMALRTAAVVGVIGS